MSYDVSLRIHTGAPEPVEFWTTNYTYNCGPMFRLALGWNGIMDLHEMKAADAVERLKRGVADMEANPAVYIAMNPENGWGDYGTAKAWLQEIAEACATHPLATIDVS